MDCTRVALWVAVLVCLALAISARWSQEYTGGAIEHFASVTESTAAATLGQSADLLISGAKIVSETEIALILGDSRFVFQEFEAIESLVVTHASQTTIQVSGADTIVARGLMVTQYFSMHATNTGLERSLNPHSRAIHVYKAPGSSDQTFGITHTTNDTPMDLTHLAAGRRPPTTFKGVRADGNMRTHLHVPTGLFATPELLKRHALAGVTLVMGPFETRCSIAFRRFRAKDGYIAFGAQLDSQKHTVTLRQATYAPGAAPRQPLNAIRGLEWDGRWRVRGSILPRDPG